jgi:hypothetical protein
MIVKVAARWTAPLGNRSADVQALTQSEALIKLVRTEPSPVWIVTVKRRLPVSALRGRLFVGLRDFMDNGVTTTVPLPYSPRGTCQPPGAISWPILSETLFDGLLYKRPPTGKVDGRPKACKKCRDRYCSRAIRSKGLTGSGTGSKAWIAGSGNAC